MRTGWLGLLVAGLAMAPGAARQQPAAAVKSDLEAGIYATTGTGPVAMAMEMSSGADVNGKLRPSMTYTYTGTTADLRLGAQPEFTFVMPRAKQSNDPVEMMRTMSMMQVKPDQFVVFRLATDQFDRRLDGKKAKQVKLRWSWARCGPSAWIGSQGSPTRT
ncbi:MAG: hypothetical protein ABIX28_24325 [Vicinamibacterales bacterium]